MRVFGVVVAVCLVVLGLWALIETDSPKDLEFAQANVADTLAPNEVALIGWDPLKDSLMSGSDNQARFSPDSLGCLAEADSVLHRIYERQKVIYENGKCYEHDIRNFSDVIPTQAVNRYMLRVVCGCGFGYELKAKSQWAECTINEYGEYAISPPRESD